MRNEKAQYEDIKSCLEDIMDQRDDFIDEMINTMEGESPEDVIKGFKLYFRFVKAALQGRSSEDIRYEILLDKAESIEQTVLADVQARLRK